MVGETRPMNAHPQLQTALGALFASWLRECQQQVAAYAAQNGYRPTPGMVAGACPATFGDPVVAAWALEQKGHVHPLEELEHECGSVVLRREPLPVPG